MEFKDLSETEKDFYYDLSKQCLDRDLYYCSRTWQAWNIKTMSEEDFHNAHEDDTLIHEVAVLIWQKTNLRDKLNILAKQEELNPNCKIQGIILDETHIGSKVTYIPRHANGNIKHKDCEHGRIKSWNDGGVFVDYIKNVCRTDFNDLVWG